PPPTARHVVGVNFPPDSMTASGTHLAPWLQSASRPLSEAGTSDEGTQCAPAHEHAGSALASMTGGPWGSPCGSSPPSLTPRASVTLTVDASVCGAASLEATSARPPSTALPPNVDEGPEFGSSGITQRTARSAASKAVTNSHAKRATQPRMGANRKSR